MHIINFILNKYFAKYAPLYYQENLNKRKPNTLHARAKYVYIYTVQFEFLFKENNSIYNADWIPFSWKTKKNRLFLKLFHFFKHYVRVHKGICEQGTINERHEKMESVLFISSYLFPINIKNQHRNKSDKKENLLFFLNIFRCDLSFGFSVFSIYI